MRRFTQLFVALDESNKTSVKVAALENYFRSTPPGDAAWALFFLTGNRLRAPVKTSLLREWVGELGGFEPWIVDECYAHVGDLAETIALLLPEPESRADDLSLADLVEGTLKPLRAQDDAEKRRSITDMWQQLNPQERFVFNKLITGAFRVGVSRTLVVRALAAVAGIDRAVMEHRIMGTWEPTAADFQRLLEAEDKFDDPARPYPFCLAYPLQDEKQAADLDAFLGPTAAWQIEWKWDGIRAQLIRRQGQLMLWSRGEEVVTGSYPDIAVAAEFLPDGTVLDGEILAWKDGRPMPFSELQKRLGRKRVTAAIQKAVPAAFMAYDCLEAGGIDLREQPTHARRHALEAIIPEPGTEPPLLLSPIVKLDTWEAYGNLRNESRERAVEGFMLKRATSPYRVGRMKGDWWKWKVDPFTIDAIMIYAQAGHGRRAGLYTDYTFAVWDGDTLVPFTKAYSGLSDAEFSKVDAFIKKNTLEKFGPVRSVSPELVFEIGFEGIRESSRHKSGIALRFPRMLRWRQDKLPQEADTLDTLRALLATGQQAPKPADEEQAELNL